jgi:dipeptidyl aminopeptidase/acylaminoacyl peptidase
VLLNLEAARNASPSEYVSSDDAPFFIVHGTSDPVVPPGQSQLLHDRLTAKEVPSTLTFIPNAGHGGPLFTEPVLLDRVADFIRKASTSGPKPR